MPMVDSTVSDLTVPWANHESNNACRSVSLLHVANQTNNVSKIRDMFADDNSLVITSGVLDGVLFSSLSEATMPALDEALEVLADKSISIPPHLFCLVRQPFARRRHGSAMLQVLKATCAIGTIHPSCPRVRMNAFHGSPATPARP